MCLSEDQIIKLIIEYVKDKRCNQAILIDGDWGSGKTYFVKGNLFNALKTRCDKKIVYISLYGIENLQQVLDEIYISLMEGFLQKK